MICGKDPKEIQAVLVITRMAMLIRTGPKKSDLLHPHYQQIRDEAIRLFSTTKKGEHHKNMLIAFECIALKRKFPKSISKKSIRDARMMNRWLEVSSK